jgi:hypothetical protein
MNWKTQEEETPPIGKWVAIIVSGGVHVGIVKVAPGGARFWSCSRGRLADESVLAWLELPKWTGVVRTDAPGATKAYSTPAMRSARWLAHRT